MRRPYFFSGFVLLIAAILIGFAIRAEAKTAVEIFNGGTGTSTAPAYGQVLIGGKNGEYEFVASSTLGSMAVGFSTTSAAFWLTQQSTSNLTEGSNLYFTNARAISALTGQSNSIFTNGAGYLTSLAGAASSTLLTDSNTFSGTTQLATTTTASLNGVITVIGWPYAQNDTGLKMALSQCGLHGIGEVFAAAGSYSITSIQNVPSNCTLAGVGTTTLFNMAAGARILATSTVNVHITGIHFDGINQNAFDALAEVSNSSNSLMDYNLVTNSHGFGLFINADDKVPHTNNTIDHNTATGECVNDVLGGGASVGSNISDTKFTFNTAAQDCTVNIPRQSRGL